MRHTCQQSIGRMRTWLNSPSGHAMHTGEPAAGECVPGRHALQVEDVEDRFDVNPVLQFRQALLLGDGEYVPPEHDEHVDSPFADEK
jgi:hypothetical protein